MPEKGTFKAPPSQDQGTVYSISFGYSGSSAKIFSGLLQAQGRGSINICYGWFLEQTLSAPQRWEHCQWLFTQMTDVFPPPACRHASLSLFWSYVIHHSVWHFRALKRNYKKALPASKGLFRPIPASQGTFSRHFLAKLRDCEELGQAY